MPKFSPADLSSWLQLAPLVIQLVDYIVSLIERLFAASSGTAKKEKALALTKAVLPPMPDGSPVPTQVLSKLIDNQVTLNNTAGVFTHSKPGVVDPELTSVYA